MRIYLSRIVNGHRAGRMDQGLFLEEGSKSCLVKAAWRIKHGRQLIHSENADKQPQRDKMVTVSKLGLDISV